MPGALSMSTEEPRSSVDLRRLRDVLAQPARQLPSLRELWMENGRYLTARSGVLVVRVVDIKDRHDSRYLICDGGRTNHALVSDWQRNPLFTLPRRTGTPVASTICGPTCMAFDRLARLALADDVRVGDLVVWQHAGAYHVPWETRFSAGWCPVLWAETDGTVSVVRAKETFEQWWGQWV